VIKPLDVLVVQSGRCIALILHCEFIEGDRNGNVSDFLNHIYKKLHYLLCLLMRMIYIYTVNFLLIKNVSTFCYFFSVLICLMNRKPLLSYLISYNGEN